MHTSFRAETPDYSTLLLLFLQPAFPLPRSAGPRVPNPAQAWESQALPSEL